MLHKPNGLKIISGTLSAPAISAYMMLLFVAYSPNGLGTLSQSQAAGLGLLFLLVLPGLPLVYSARRGHTDLDVTDRHKRTPFYAIALASYAAGTATFWLLGAHTLAVLCAAYLAVTAAVTIINLFWKISAHAAGVAGPATALVYVFGLYGAPAFLFTPLVMWVRLRLRAHTLGQLVAGALVAIAVTAAVYFALW